jgi:hypothetical protein
LESLLAILGKNLDPKPAVKDEIPVSMISVFRCFPGCDRHGREIAGASPAIALERREYVGKGKGARRNFPNLPEEG